MSLQRDFWVKNGVLGENGFAKGLWVKNGVLGKMGMQRDFWIVLGENWCAKGLLG